MSSGGSPKGGRRRLLNRKSAMPLGGLHSSIADTRAAPALDPNLHGGGTLFRLSYPILDFIASLMAGDPRTNRAIDDWIASAEAPARMVP